ncbi:MAG: glycosyltransferase, partial [Actinomycetota bacterium]|nr:glycosyltransferase [Actinomycetota bacterium]
MVFITQMLGHDGDAAGRSWRKERPRVLLITTDRVAEQMAGPAIRCWELGHLLSEHADVTLAAADTGSIGSDTIELVRFIAHSPRAIRRHIAEADVIIAQPQWSVIASWMRRSRARVIYDLYDPETLETLETFANGATLERYMWLELTLDRLQDALRGGHHFLCASERQRDLWIGAMYGQRLIGPTLYDRDPSFRSIIDVVPFGLPQEPPPAPACSVVRNTFPAIAPDDEIVLWNGGIWNWLDPACAVRAFAHLRERRPRARLVFMGAGTMAAARDAAARARRAAIDAELLDRSVFFNEEWVPYGERSAWLRDADCAVGTHLEHLETRFAFRTRLLDCFWAGLPAVCTEGDDLSERVRRDGLGEAVLPGDDVALAAALERVLDRGRASYAGALAKVAAEYAWPRVAEPLVQFVMNARPTRPLGGHARGPWRRESPHQARFVAYQLSHHALHRA